MVSMEIKKEKNRTVIQERYITMKIGKQVIIPVAVILILGLYLGINSTGKIHYQVPVFENMEEEIKLIEINKLSETYKLFSDNDIWKFSSDNLRVEPSKVTEMISFLRKPNFIDMVSDSGNYVNYGLDDGSYLTISAFTDIDDENNPKRKLILGSLNSTGNFTYIRIPENKNVYTVSGDLNSLFALSKNELLDKRVTSFDITDIERITLSSLDLNYILIKSVGENNKDIWVTSTGSPIKIEKLEQNIRYLSNSRFNTYIENNNFNKQDALFKIELSGKNLNESFEIFQKIDSEYLSYSTFTNKNFFLSENTGTQIIKMFNDLIGINE